MQLHYTDYLTIAVGMFIGSMVLAYIYLPRRHEPKLYLINDEPDNMERQIMYIAKRIEGMQRSSESEYIEALINHFYITFIDDPDIASEVEDMRTALQMQSNYLSVEEMQQRKFLDTWFRVLAGVCLYPGILKTKAGRIPL